MGLQGVGVWTVIVTYNGGLWLKDCLESVQKATEFVRSKGARAGVVVVDNHSNDGSQAIFSGFPDIEFVRLRRNRGFGQGNNIGISRSLKHEADYVFLLNQDAYLDEDGLYQLVKDMHEAPEYGVLSPIHFNGDGTGLDFAFAKYCVWKGYSAETLMDPLWRAAQPGALPLKFVNAAAWMIRRECLSSVGGFCPVFFMYGEDFNYIDRVTRKGYRVGFSPHAGIRHDRESRDHAEGFRDPVSSFYVESAAVLSRDGISRAGRLMEITSLFWSGLFGYGFKGRLVVLFNRTRMLMKLLYRWMRTLKSDDPFRYLDYSAVRSENGNASTPERHHGTGTADNTKTSK